MEQIGRDFVLASATTQPDAAVARAAARSAARRLRKYADSTLARVADTAASFKEAWAAAGLRAAYIERQLNAAKLRQGYFFPPHW